MKVKVAYPSGNLLGEGPVWSVEQQAIYWVDIMNPAICRWQPLDNDFQSWEMPEHIGSLALRKDGTAIISLRTGFAFFDFKMNKVTAIADPESEMEDTRLNDGKCDRLGRFWAGSMDYKESNPIGSLYRMDTKGNIKKMRSGVTISNGLGWSPDNKTMYYTDSAAQRIYAYDFDLETGEMTNERLFVKDEIGFPDGLTVDSEGYIWSAKWDGWRVVRYAPDGSTDRIMEVPVARPSSCTFGGPELNQLFITTASVRLSKEELSKQPWAGHLLVAETNVKGLPEPLYGG